MPKYWYFSADPAALMHEPGYWDRLLKLDGTPASPEQVEAAKKAAQDGQIEVRSEPLKD